MTVSTPPFAAPKGAEWIEFADEWVLVGAPWGNGYRAEQDGVTLPLREYTVLERVAR